MCLVSVSLKVASSLVESGVSLFFFPAVFLGPLPDSSEFLMDFPEQT